MSFKRRISKMNSNPHNYYQAKNNNEFQCHLNGGYPKMNLKNTQNYQNSRTNVNQYNKLQHSYCQKDNLTNKYYNDTYYDQYSVTRNKSIYDQDQDQDQDQEIYTQKDSNSNVNIKDLNSFYTKNYYENNEELNNKNKKNQKKKKDRQKQKRNKKNQPNNDQTELNDSKINDNNSTYEYKYKKVNTYEKNTKNLTKNSNSNYINNLNNIIMNNAAYTIHDLKNSKYQPILNTNIGHDLINQTDNLLQESVSSSEELPSPLKIYQDTDMRYFLTVQTFKFNRQVIADPEQPRLLALQERDNHPAVDQFLNTVWRWLHHKQNKNMNKLTVWMPEQLHCEDWFCKRCYYYNEHCSDYCQNEHCALNRLNNEIILVF
eukprot:Mrub_02601.p1 GENE.Mrub_02601~~Mrub_02601.p1  ORF type:complete len:373 (+),score=79.41 Mrub_02601:518-1636(+)